VLTFENVSKTYEIS